MPNRLLNKTAIITGSSSGIGRATALAFASEGANLICSDITPNFRLEHSTDTLAGTTVEEACALGVRAVYQHCDTTSSSDVEALIKRAVQEFGRLDIMVNNAGIAIETTPHGPRPIWDVEEAAFDKTLDVNVKGVFLGIKYASAQMRSQEPWGDSGDRGWIINLASVFGLGGGPNTGTAFLSFCSISQRDLTDTRKRRILRPNTPSSASPALPHGTAPRPASTSTPYVQATQPHLSSTACSVPRPRPNARKSRPGTHSGGSGRRRTLRARRCF
jgi:NAD(P)-dependent dehydrogenase (short-subunit alcohol dehydrogenase family)